MPDFKVLDWHRPLWQRLAERIDRLPHALLLSGPRGIGKSRFATALAARLLCERPGEHGFACGTCEACGWFAAGNHPDLRLLQPDIAEAAGSDEEGAEPAAGQKKKSDQIVIEQIRGLEEFVNLGSHRQGYRIIVIRPAEAMNPAAANSILKMLEEPAPSVLFFLISDNPKRLLPTIRSRCQVISFPRPEAGAAEDWLGRERVAGAADLLRRVGGMPLAAKAASEAGLAEKWNEFIADLAEAAESGSLAAAGRWETQLKQDKDGALDKPTLVAWLQKWVYDLVSTKLTGQARYYPGEARRLSAIAGRAGVPNLVECYNELLRVRAVARHPLNPRLFLEDLFARYLKGVAPGK